MPYKSDAQRRWAHTKTGEEALGGKAAVHEWDEATKGKDLPERVSKSQEMAEIVKKELIKQGFVKISGVKKLHEFLANRKLK